MGDMMLKKFRKPDVKAPRCRPGASRLVNKTFLDELASCHPETKDLGIADVNKILQTMHGKMWDHAANYRDGIELFEQLGFVFVGTCNSPKKYNVDYGNSIKNGSTLRHRNFESDNYLAKIFYTNFASKYKFKNRDMWMFEPTRAFQRTVSKIYPEKWKIFVQVENNRNISRYIEKAMKSSFIKKRSMLPVDDNYDEFNLD
jgi:hypothetical protein